MATVRNFAGDFGTVPAVGRCLDIGESRLSIKAESLCLLVRAENSSEVPSVRTPATL